MVKQSWTSARSRSPTPTEAISRARPTARRPPANSRTSRIAGSRWSLAWPTPTIVARDSPGSRRRTRAAAPSLTGEQSVRRSGPATTGFFSEVVEQNSTPRSLRSWAHGLAQPLRWFFAAMAPRVSPSQSVELTRSWYSWATSAKIPANPAGASVPASLGSAPISAWATATPDACVIFSTPMTRAVSARPASDGPDALVDRRRAGGAGVLDPGHGPPPQPGRRTGKRRRGGEQERERRQAAVEGADDDLVHLLGADPGVQEGLQSSPARRGSVPSPPPATPERGVRDTDDADRGRDGLMRGPPGTGRDGTAGPCRRTCGEGRR